MQIVHLAKFKCRTGHTNSDTEYYGTAYGLQRFDRTAAPYIQYTRMQCSGAAQYSSCTAVVVSTIFRHDLNLLGLVVTCPLATYSGSISPSQDSISVLATHIVAIRNSVVVGLDFFLPIILFLYPLKFHLLFLSKNLLFFLSHLLFSIFDGKIPQLRIHDTYYSLMSSTIITEHSHLGTKLCLEKISSN